MAQLRQKLANAGGVGVRHDDGDVAVMVAGVAAAGSDAAATQADQAAALGGGGTFTVTVAPPNKRLRMCHHQQRRRSVQGAVESEAEGLGIEGGEALVENEKVTTLQQRPREVDPALLTV